MGNSIVDWVKKTMETAPLLIFNVTSLSPKELQDLVTNLKEFKVEISEDKDITIKRLN